VQTTTRLQQAAYNAQLAAGLPVSEQARAVLACGDAAIPYRSCATYIHGVQQTEWFRAAFTAHTEPVTVLGGRGRSRADAEQRWVRIGVEDRWDTGRCEHACLHELAHIVTPDVGGPDHARREPLLGRDSSKGHHHAWRANFVLIVRMTLGSSAALRLRREFDQWGLPTRR
jgi:putative metallohydrolase (TIGR04338 family)